MTARKTKRACGNAFRSLMDEKPFAKITVSQIADRAGVSRKTLYNYFHNKYDVANWYCKAELVRIRKAPLDQCVGGAIAAFAEYFADDRAFFVDLLSDRSREAFGTFLESWLCEVLGRFYEEDLLQMLQDVDEANAVLDQVAHSYARILIAWVTNASKPSVAVLQKRVDVYRRVLLKK